MRTARWLAVAALLGALALWGAVSVAGAPSKPDFSLAVSPTAQSVAKGSAGTYSVTITRQGGFSGPVALSVTSGLAAGMTVSFSPASPVSGSTTTMTVTTSGATPTGNKSLTLKGVAGGNIKDKTAAFSLNVQTGPTPAFDLVVSPSARTITQDDSTSFDIQITRLDGYTSAVALSVSGLPKKTTGSFASPSIAGPAGTSSVLSLVAEHNAEIGVFPLSVTGTGGGVTRTATVTLRIDKKQTLLIAGDAATVLYPGGQPSVIDLSLTNPNNFPVRVGPLTVSVEEHTSKPGCSGTQDFGTSGLVGTVDVPANTTATLTALGVSTPNLPKVWLIDRPLVNQDACKNAQITMQYDGTAVKP